MVKSRNTSATVRYDSFVVDQYFYEKQVGVSAEQLRQQIETSLKERRFLTTKQAASRYSLSVDRFEKWRWSGEGPPYIKLDGKRVEFGAKDTAEAP